MSLNLNATSATPGDEYGYQQGSSYNCDSDTDGGKDWNESYIPHIEVPLVAELNIHPESGKGAVPLSMLFTRLRRVAAIGVFATALLVAASS